MSGSSTLTNVSNNQNFITQLKTQQQKPQQQNIQIQQLQHQQQQQQQQQNIQAKAALNTQQHQLSNLPMPNMNSAPGIPVNSSTQQIINIQQQQIKTEPIRTATPNITATQVINANGPQVNQIQQNLNNQALQQQQQQQRNIQQPLTSNQQVQQGQQPSQSQTQPQPSPMDLLKCLRKFLHTLLDLANNSLPEKYPLVRNLIQDLLVRSFRHF